MATMTVSPNTTGGGAENSTFARPNMLSVRCPVTTGADHSTSPVVRSKQPRWSSMRPRSLAMGTSTRAPTTVGGPTTVMRSAKEPESPSQPGGGMVFQSGSPVSRSRAMSRRSGISSMIDISLYWSRCSNENGI